ncbi:FlgB family protein [Pelagovum sp. HNIBRBA483]|uniref:FlgB family protein n=1 Tax=Pelagovum sp. HNIBRBA483 TaxID=3233341 RepID=UPI0034A120B5
MYQSLTVFEIAGALGAHAGRSQALTAQNIANADTPGYRPQRLTAFEEAYRTGASLTAVTTRSNHITSAPSRFDSRTETGAAISPNGNGVSLEKEMMEGIDADRSHKRALAIYRHGMTVLRLAIGR